MKTVTAGGKNFEIRPLTRAEVKTLKKEELDPRYFTMDNVDDVIDAVLQRVFPGQLDQIDELPNPDVSNLFREIIGITFGRDEDAEKNSSTSEPGSTEAG